MAGLWEEGAKLLGKVISKGEKGAKLTVEWSSKTGKALNGSKSIIKHDLTEGKVLSRPMAEANKSEAFMKKFGNVTYKTKEGKEASRFVYSGGKVHDMKLGESIRPKDFPGRLSSAKKEMESLGQVAGKTAKTRNYGGWGKMFTYDEVKRNVKGALPYWLPLGALGIWVESKFKGQGMIQTALGEASGGNGVVNDLGVGILGPEGYDGLKDNLAGVVQEMKNLYGSGKSAVGGVSDEFIEFYQKVKETGGNIYQAMQMWGTQHLSPEYNANGYVVDENGNYVDQTTQPYPNMVNGTGGVTGQISDLTKKLAGDGVTPMNLATLLLSGYMMFCRAGWMSKAAGMLMGGMTMKSVGNHRQQMMQNGQAQGQSQANQQVRSEYNVAAVDNENRETYHVSRGM